MTQNLVAPSLYPTAADLALVNGAAIFNNHVAVVAQISAGIAVPARYRFVVGSTSPDNNSSQLIIVPGTNPGSGKWVRADPMVDLVLPVTFATADNTALVTMPAELTFAPIYGTMFWEMTSSWAGGVASTIGLSMQNPAHPRNKGGLMGGVAGNSGFTSACFYQPTLGTDMSGNTQAPILSPGGKILFDRITSAFTSGAGNAHVPCVNLFTTITPVTPP